MAGRRSAAELSVITALPGQRPAPPTDLNRRQKVLWQTIVATKPFTWFTSDNFPMLATLTRTMTTLELISRQIDAVEARDPMQPEDKLEWMNLLRLRDSETKLMIKLMTSMRLTNQSRLEKDTAHNQAKQNGDATGKPWQVVK